MKYTLLLWPHANARYQQETRKLARAECALMLSRLAPEAQARIDDESAMPGLIIEAEKPLDAATVSALRSHSLLYGLFEAREDGSLLPIAGRESAYLGSDLPSILKYKGKTNELFLQLMVNVALYAGDFWREEGPLSLLDPMCGRATAPFIALNRGWNATGADVDRADLKEAEKFFKRYLEYHRFKHAQSQDSRTVQGKKAVPVTRFDVSDTPEHYREKQTLSLRLMNLDAALIGQALGKQTFHLAVCDLPYGVKHDAQVAASARQSKNWLEALIAQTLRGLMEVLKPGGTAAMSFNAQTLSLHKLRGLMADAGFEVLSGGDYDQFEHWVEQAITRDIAVCRKPGSLGKRA